jgi:hypothetical protein
MLLKGLSAVPWMYPYVFVCEICGAACESEESKRSLEKKKQKTFDFKRSGECRHPFTSSGVMSADILSQAVE